jgi:ubiquitin carboxyl-terminal hydrolase 10
VQFNGCPAVGSPNNGALIKNVKSEATVPSAGPVSNAKEAEAVVPSAGRPASNVKKAEASAPSAGPVKYVKKTEAPVPPAAPVKNVKKTEAATVLSPGPINNVKKVPLAGHANNVKKTEAKVSSPGPVNSVKKTESVVPSGVPVKNITSSTPTQGGSSAMQVTENGSTGVDAPIVAAAVDESTPSLNKEAYQNKPVLPHGLKNTGNICFLNATLQAFLSCSPFVQLLQDLRNRSIPKVLNGSVSCSVCAYSHDIVLNTALILGWLPYIECIR